MYPHWSGVLTRKQAIQIFDSATDKDDPYWEGLVEDFYDEKTDTMPSIYHVFDALGVTPAEYKDATGAENVDWPAHLSGDDLPKELCGFRVYKDAEGQWFFGRPKGPAIYWEKCELGDLLNLGLRRHDLEVVVVNHIYSAQFTSVFLDAGDGSTLPA